MTEQAPMVRRPATYRDVLDAPPHMIAQLIRGALHLQPRPARRHIRASSRLGNKLGPPFDEGVGGPGGWEILDEPELHLGDDVLVPDLAGWRRERIQHYPVDAAFFDLAPDWVCEILSPSTRKLDLGEKREIYAASGVGFLWFIDPVARSLEAFALQGEDWARIATLAGDAEVRVAPFDAVVFPLAALWPDTGAPTD